MTAISSNKTRLKNKTVTVAIPSNLSYSITNDRIGRVFFSQDFCANVSATPVGGSGDYKFGVIV